MAKTVIFEKKSRKREVNIKLNFLCYILSHMVTTWSYFHFHTSVTYLETYREYDPHPVIRLDRRVHRAQSVG